MAVSFTLRLLDRLAAQGERLQGRFVKVICLQILSSTLHALRLPLCALRLYSYRNASIGFRRDALRAG